MITFKEPQYKDEFEKLDNRLRVILFSLDGYVKYKFNKDIILTSLYRPGDPGVHGVYRGADVRCWTFSKDEQDDILKFLNHFKYSGKTTIIIHNAGSGEHFHIQVDWDGVTELT